ncbi:MAG: response regulator [Candidatus Scalindua sp.]
MSDIGRILVADDEDTFLQATADLLRGMGYECNCANDAKAVTEMLRSTEYDLLITDINMPGNKDLKLIKDLQNYAKEIPVILMTGEPSLLPSIQSVQPPVVICLIKPFDFNDLLEHVKISIEK